MNTQELFQSTSEAVGNLKQGEIDRLSPSALLNLAALQGILLTLCDIRQQQNILIHLASGGTLDQIKQKEPQEDVPQEVPTGEVLSLVTKES